MRNKEPFGLTSPVVTICTARLYIKKLRVLAFPVILTTSRMVHVALTWSERCRTVETFEILFIV